MCALICINDTRSYVEGFINFNTDAKLHLVKHAQSIHLLINANFMPLYILKRSGLRRCPDPASETTLPLSVPYLFSPISHTRVLLRFSSDKHRSKDCLINTRWRNQSGNVNWDKGAKGHNGDLLLPSSACSFGNINVLLFVRPINRITEK